MKAGPANSAGSRRVTPKRSHSSRARSVTLQEQGYPLDEVYFALCKDVNTPISLGLWLRFKHGEFRAIAEFELPIGDYLEKDVDKLRGDYLVQSYLKKFKGLATGIDKEQVAILGFISSEEKCRKTNQRFRAMRRAPIEGRLSALISSAKRKIAKLLGPMSLFCIDPFSGWSPGATYDLPRRRAQVDTKMTAIPITVAPKALGLLASEISLDLHWSCALLGHIPEGPFSWVRGTFLGVDSCRVTTVPKSSKTDRVIAVEPTGSVFLQKGVGSYLRQCLKRRGIDLDDQGTNQKLAGKAYSEGLATLDLKAASDTVSTELVYELLPLDWAFLIDALRSHKAEMPDGTLVSLNKFSSMGNGFTFELETLIFWALGQSVLDEGPGGVLSVYGDDVIISRESAPELIRLLQFCGFELNRDKSFLDGLFFESCGEHYFRGENVTPCYQKEALSNGAELIRAHNRLARWCLRHGRDPKGFPPVSRLRRFADPELARCVVHYVDEADTGFLSDLDCLLEMASRLDENRGARVRAVVNRQKTYPGQPAALLALKLRKNVSQRQPDPLQRGWFKREEEPQASPIWEGVNPPERSDNVSVPLPSTRMSYGYRWVVTPGYCPLKRR